jgi:hypothetical protein
LCAQLAARPASILARVHKQRECREARAKW